MTRAKRRWIGGLVGLALLAALILGASTFVEHSYPERIVPAAQARHAPVALVFGAGLAPGAEPSPVLAARLDTAVALFKDHRVDQLLLSGDGSDRHHDETRVMKRYVTQAGVPAEAVQLDPAGLSTYDSCYRAQSLFGVRRALLVTQSAHLTRALFIANSLGINADGVAADQAHKGHGAFSVHELFSRALALAMVVARPSPQRVDLP